MTADDVRVCPRCGEPAGEDDYCATCGLHLAEQRQLPTLGEFEAGGASRDWTKAEGSGGAATFSLGWRIAAAVAVVTLLVVLFVTVVGGSVASGCRDEVESDLAKFGGSGAIAGGDSAVDSLVRVCVDRVESCKDNDMTSCDEPAEFE